MAKKGDKYECPECGLVVIVEDDCGCSECDIICCDMPMEPVAEKKPTRKAAPKKPTAAKKKAAKKPAPKKKAAM